MDQPSVAQLVALGHNFFRPAGHKAERSGALLIKEATQKGYQAAAPGDSVDLG